jgi:quinol-cytochrome oxidoreductase complex cytochrome b subunit
MKQAAKQKHPVSSHPRLRRYVSGIGLVCLVIIIIGSSTAGARPLTIGERAVWFIVCYFFAFYLLEKLWISWQEVNEGTKKR